MKRTLYLKLITGFVLFGILGFLIVATFTSHYTAEYMEKKEADSLYREATLIANTYATNYFSSSMTLDELQEQLSLLDSYLSAQIWIVNTSGEILVNSREAVDMAHLSKVEGLNIADFGNRYYDTGDFYGSFSQTQLSVFSQITMNYKVKGYVFIHKPVKQMITYHDDLLNISYLTLLILVLIAFALLGVLLLTIYRPLCKIIKAADAYAEGDFNYKINAPGSGEIGYIAASFNYMANELNTLEDDQRKFVSNVSHDFRSPLTSIKGYVEAMLDGTIPVEMQEKYLNIILFETERLTKLTHSLLELNKYGSHGTMLDRTDFDINQTIKTTALTFEGICKEKRISFHLILTGQQLFVTADMTKIQQVLYNLIDNAIKFSHHDSQITIETTAKNEKVFVSVKDTGIGIPKDSLSKIWERFYKTDLSRGKDKKGTGLGLAIVKEIIQAHDENINVISTEGVGTEFIFTLPLSEKSNEVF